MVESRADAGELGTTPTIFTDPASASSSRIECRASSGYRATAPSGRAVARRRWHCDNLHRILRRDHSRCQIGAVDQLLSGEFQQPVADFQAGRRAGRRVSAVRFSTPARCDPRDPIAARADRAAAARDDRSTIYPRSTRGARRRETSEVAGSLAAIVTIPYSSRATRCMPSMFSFSTSSLGRW